MLAGVTELIARSVVAFGFVGKFGFNAVCYASPIAWIAAAVLLTVVYFLRSNILKRDILIIKKLSKNKNTAGYI